MWMQGGCDGPKLEKWTNGEINHFYEGEQRCFDAQMMGSYPPDMNLCCRCDFGDGMDKTDRCWLHEGMMGPDKDWAFMVQGYSEWMPPPPDFGGDHDSWGPGGHDDWGMAAPMMEMENDCAMNQKMRIDGSCKKCKKPYVQTEDGYSCEFVGYRKYGRGKKEATYMGRLRDYK